MLGQKSFDHLFVSAAAVIWTIALTLCPHHSEAGEVYTYTNEKGVIVVTNTPVEGSAGKQAKKIGSYRDITDEDRKGWEKEKEDAMQAWRDEQARQEQTTKQTPDTGKNVRQENDLREKLRKSAEETERYADSVKQSQKKAADVLDTLKPLRTFP
jgi:hypothetical protein